MPHFLVIVTHAVLTHLRRKRKGSYLLHEPIVRYWLVVMFLIGVYAPADVLDKSEILSRFTALMAVLFPPIMNYSTRSEFSQVTLLYMSLSWFFSPLHGYFFYKEYKTDAADWVKRFKDPASWPMKEKLRGWLTLLILPPLIYFMTFIAKGHDFNLLPINSSRMVLGIGGWFIAGGMVMLLTVYWYVQARQLVQIKAVS